MGTKITILSLPLGDFIIDGNAWQIIGANAYNHVFGSIPHTSVYEHLVSKDRQKINLAICYCLATFRSNDKNIFDANFAKQFQEQLLKDYF